ncbi:substrate-binding domain-containing protein [Rhodococcus aerolatus]
MRITRTASAGVTVAAVLALSVLNGSAAEAVPAPNGYLDSITLAGSDTIQDVDTALTAQFNAEPADGDKVTNVPAFFSGAVTSPGDRSCAPITYAQTPGAGQTQAPAGSGAGKNALRASVAAGNGCVDVARSSSGRGSSDPATFEYYAFAKDAVGFATFQQGLSLTTAQLRGIYNCTLTNFNQVGGPNQQIQRYLPQASSGTRGFFVGTVLGGADPTTVSSASCPAVTIINENDASQIASGSQPAAILPYSAAQYVAQGNQVRKPDGTRVADLRNGAVIGTLDGQNPVTGSAPNLAPNTTVYNSSYIGARNVYHVLDNTSVSYTEALRYLGFDSNGPSQLCSGAYSATLLAYGFAPLPANRAGYTCSLS